MFETLLSALKAEREEEQRQFDELMRRTSLAQRSQSGMAWFPLQIQTQGWSVGAHPFIVVERLKQVNQPHKFRAGQVVSVFTEGSKKEPALSEKGVLHFVEKNRMKIIFYGTELPNWILHSTIGVQIEFDERSYIEMETCLREVAEAKGNRLAELRDVLLGKSSAQFDREHFAYELPRLNASQRGAVHQILSARDLALVHGPPGTGKTTTLVEALLQLSKQQQPILVCAPSNAATDLLTERLAAKGLFVVRLGNISRVDERLLGHTLDGILDRRPEMEEAKKMKIQAQQAFRQAEKFRRNFGPQERQERQDAYKEARALLQHAKILEDYVLEKILDEAQIITATLVGANHEYLQKRHFKTVVIDEAAQALEPATWIPIRKADRVILAGDPFQLPPTVKSTEANRLGLNKTLLERCISQQEVVSLLDTQYRMNKKIMGFSNAEFYENRLRADDSVADWTLWLQGLLDDKPIEFIDTAGCGFEEKINPENQSYYNPEEYYLLRQHLDRLLTHAGAESPSIGLLSPYREQVVFMQEHLPEDFDHFPQANLTVDTIDAFQGQERDVMYISLVRSNEQCEIGFLKDTRRMNVAMTRARKKLVIIGDSATLGAFPFYSRLLAYCESIDAYDSAWSWS